MWSTNEKKRPKQTFLEYDLLSITGPPFRLPPGIFNLSTVDSIVSLCVFFTMILLFDLLCFLAIGRGSSKSLSLLSSRCLLAPTQIFGSRRAGELTWCWVLLPGAATAREGKSPRATTQTHHDLQQTWLNSDTARDRDTDRHRPDSAALRNTLKSQQHSY